MSSKKLFGDHIDPRCCYCVLCSVLNERQMLCRKHGVVDAGYQCKNFRYDPLKRIPTKPAIIRGVFSDDDFNILDD